MASGLETATVLGAIGAAMVGAKAAGWGATQFRVPAVLGELFIGVIFGAVPFLGDILRTSPEIHLLAELGVLLLLFEVGLESSIADLRRVGWVATLVAIVGVGLPVALGLGTGAWLFPEAGFARHLFVAAALAATSVGITARVLRDLGKSQAPESRIILGAAVIDDVLGLILLGLVTAFVTTGGTADVASVGAVVGKAVAYVVLALLIGTFALRPLFARLEESWVLPVAMATLLFFSFGAELFGLAAVLGAFFAGLALDDAPGSGTENLRVELETPGRLFIPIFFVVTGAQVNLASFVEPQTLLLGAALSVVAIVGKVASGLVAGQGVSKWVVGVGMVPRGEVGLLFASIGASLTLDGAPVLSQSLFGAVLFMVVVTTALAPLWLQWLLRGRPTS